TLPVKLESVAALQAIVDVEKANRGLFITTSRYLPQAKKFAARHQRRLKLADTTDLKNWCDKARTVIIRDKSQIIETDYIKGIIATPSLTDCSGKIVRASVGYNTVNNDFCIVLKDGFNAALLMRLPTKAVKYYDSPHNFRGDEIPLLDGDFLQHKNKEGIFRASKSISASGEVTFWGQRHLYSLWDGTPQYFDWID
ncbi:MAG: hypothetical protein JWO06_2649, partial [Bacteroidota bacterium]|nr:hypothetical protein [Bacteroidota bacterium]